LTGVIVGVWQSVIEHKSSGLEGLRRHFASQRQDHRRHTAGLLPDRFPRTEEDPTIPDPSVLPKSVIVFDDCPIFIDELGTSWRKALS